MSSKTNTTDNEPFIIKHIFALCIIGCIIVFIATFAIAYDHLVTSLKSIALQDQQEHDKVSKMSCMELHDYLTKDKPFSSWNRQYASNLYLVNCK